MTHYRLFMFSEVFMIFHSRHQHGGKTTRSLNRVLSILGIDKTFSEENTSVSSTMCKFVGLKSVKSERDTYAEGKTDNELVQKIQTQLAKHKKDFYLEEIFEDSKELWENELTYIPKSYGALEKNKLRSLCMDGRQIDFISYVLFYTFFKFSNDFNELRDEILQYTSNPKHTPDLNDEDFESLGSKLLKLENQNTELNRRFSDSEIEHESLSTTLFETINENTALKRYNKKIIQQQYQQKLTIEELNKQVENYDKLYREQKELGNKLSTTIKSLQADLSTYKDSSKNIEQLTKIHKEEINRLSLEKNTINRDYLKILDEVEKYKKEIESYEKENAHPQSIDLTGMFDMDSIISELNLNHLSQKELENIKLQIQEDIEVEVGERITEGLSQKVNDEFENIIADEPGYIKLWINQHAPNFESDPIYLALKEDSSDLTEEDILSMFASMKWLQLNRPDFIDVIFDSIEKIKQRFLEHSTFNVEERKAANTIVIKRSDPCPCGSGKKYKNCHGRTTN